MYTVEQAPSEASVFPCESGQLPSTVLKAALDDPQAGLLIFDRKLRLLHATSQISPLLGFPSETPLANLDVHGLLAKSVLDRDSISAAKTRIAELSGDEALGNALILKSRDQGREISMRLRSVGRDYRIASFRTSHHDELLNGSNGEFARRDSLTGLASRAFFEQAVTEAFTRSPAEKISVLLLDLDRFKAVNDTLGHAAGDNLLRLAGERLKSSVRKDDLVARLGGDEFAVLIQPSPTSNEPTAIAQRILDLVQRTYLIEGQLVNVGTSMGIAQSPNDGVDYAQLLRSADLALYHSKTSGRGTFHFFDSQMDRRAQARRANELELRRALALRQLEVFYQPQVNTAIGKLVGFEALVRWRHPERGIVSPGEFLPIAEEIGLIVPLGDWVLRTACKEATKWPDDITIAVNASPQQFETGKFADAVRRALAGSGLRGDRLEIEITEGTLLNGDEVTLNTLHDLRSNGVRIAMDDFGTGYASLSQLARFPFDKIKIDRSLAGFEGDNHKQRAIVRAITALGRSLSVCTLAEGVESAEQIVRLQKDGCTSVQGYFFSKPVPADQVGELISRLHSPIENNSN